MALGQDSVGWKMEQQIVFCGDAGNACRKVGKALRGILEEKKISKLLLVCGRSFDRLPIQEAVQALPVETVRFSDFAPNPLYEDVRRAVDLFRSKGCDGILAVGGGSAIDVAKCVKLYCRMDSKENYLKQEPADTGVPLVALPTTAGTGSESTRFAVIYYHGEKQSVTHGSILPDVAVLAPVVLRGLPEYQKKCAMLDALCQAIESGWSVNSTEESIGYARKAIEAIRANWEAHIFGNADSAAGQIMWAANYAGRAINITQTTAPHAMSYKLTGLYGLPHGHAAALCLPEVWEHMLGHMENCVDSRGKEFLAGVFAEIARALGSDSPADAVVKLRELLAELGMAYPVSTDREQDLDTLTRSVNPARLKNNPVSLDGKALRTLYEKIVREKATNHEIGFPESI